jgi:transposase
MWTFVSVEGVEPTNNFGERALRPSVLWRKSSFGTHSDAGSRFAERMMTVAATLKLQRRNVFHYLVEASEAALIQRPPPSLLPLAA